MNEVLKDLIRQKKQLEKTLVFLRKAIALRLTDEMEKGAPEGMVIKKLSAFGENQGNCKYLAAVPPNFEGELKEAYFINGYYVDNNMEDYIFSEPINFTFAALTIASAASTAATKPLVSTIPKAFPSLSPIFCSYYFYFFVTVLYILTPNRKKDILLLFFFF